MGGRRNAPSLRSFCCYAMIVVYSMCSDPAAEDARVRRSKALKSSQSRASAKRIESSELFFSVSFGLRRETPKRSKSEMSRGKSSRSRPGRATEADVVWSRVSTGYRVS